jgi:hypothetical protein
MPILLFPGGYIGAFCDHNLELTISFQGLGPVARGMRWGCKWGLHNVPTPPQQQQETGSSDPVCLRHLRQATLSV